MPKERVAFEALKQYIPEGTFEPLLAQLLRHKVHLTVARERASVLGDYRPAQMGKNHRISVNGNLNQYSFLITLLHELAHLYTFEKFGQRVAPHGNEWKYEFAEVLRSYSNMRVFPADVAQTLYASIRNPKASSCADAALLRVLKKYDAPANNSVHLEQLPEGSIFKMGDDRVFKKGTKQRTRYRCTELPGNKVWLVHGLAEVRPAT